jgi:hypothetical protein
MPIRHRHHVDIVDDPIIVEDVGPAPYVVDLDREAAAGPDLGITPRSDYDVS